MSKKRNETIGGLVFFNKDGSCGGIVRYKGAEYRVRGTYNKNEVTAVGDGVTLEYRKTERSSERAPVARGTVTIGGSVESISIFHATKDGRIFHGLAPSELAPRVDAPF